MTDKPEPAPTHGNLAPIVLIAAVPSILMGLMLLYFSQREEGLLAYGIGVTVGGLALLWFWFRWRARGNVLENSESGPPGKWFPIALFAIVFLQFAWLLYRKMR